MNQGNSHQPVEGASGRKIIKVEFLILQGHFGHKYVGKHALEANGIYKDVFELIWDVWPSFSLFFLGFWKLERSGRDFSEKIEDL